MPFSPRAEFSFQDAIGPSAEFSFVGQDGGDAGQKQRAAAAAMGAELAQQPVPYGPSPYFQAAPNVFSGFGNAPGAPPSRFGQLVKGLAIGGLAMGLFAAWKKSRKRSRKARK
jgi:hypothetical protein